MNENRPVVSARALLGDFLENETIYWIDFLIQEVVIVEIKTVEWLDSLSETQALPI